AALKSGFFVSLTHNRHDSSRPLFHSNNWQALPAGQGNRELFERGIAACTIKRNPRQGGAHLEPGEAGGLSGCLARLQNQRAYAFPRPLWPNEKGADLRGIALGIKQRIFTARPLVSSV